MREIAEEYHLEDVSMKFLFEKGILTQVIKHLVRKVEKTDKLTTQIRSKLTTRFGAN